MSEYQYYEFQAIDRPLTEKEMEELRSYSTRARITPTSFVNDYSWATSRGTKHGELPELTTREARREEIAGDTQSCAEPPPGYEKEWCEQSMLACQREYGKPAQSDCETSQSAARQSPKIPTTTTMLARRKAMRESRGKLARVVRAIPIPDATFLAGRTVGRLRCCCSRSCSQLRRVGVASASSAPSNPIDPRTLVIDWEG